MTKWWLAFVLAVACAGCGGDQSSEQLTVPSASAEPTVGAAPVVVVRTGASRVEVVATRWSGERFAADGTRPARPVEVGPSAEIVVEFAKPEMVFVASLKSTDGGATFDRTMSKVDATTFHLDSIGRAGVFDVALFGQGPTDVVEVWVRWNATI
jgi:hypothetical protein